MDFALRCVRFYPGVNSRAELVTLARAYAPLARGLWFARRLDVLITPFLPRFSVASNRIDLAHE